MATGSIDQHEAEIQKRSKIVQHPNAEGTPLSTCAEALGVAQSGLMVDCCIMWADRDGNYHLGWSNMSNVDLAAYAILLSHVAGRRLVEFDPPSHEALPPVA